MRWILVALIFAAGCAGSPELVVTAKTDFAPGVEFATVRVVLHDAAAQTATRAAAAADPFVDGVRVATFSTSNGTVSLTVALLDASGSVVVSRDVSATVSGTTAVTVLLSRTCTNVRCPGPGDPADATSCEGGHCVSPTCTTGCTMPECAAASDCTALMSSCASASCDHGTCFYVSSCDGGVGATFCPDAATLRQQMAVFLLRLEHGTSYTPPAATGMFTDVPASSSFAPYIEQLVREGISAGCGSSTFCPNAEVTRWQAAVLLEKAMNGPTYAPPSAMGRYSDVPSSEVYADYVEKIAHDGIMDLCHPGLFCPDDPFLRRDAAVDFLRAHHGAGYMPPPATGVFADVPTSDDDAASIEKFASDGYASGCSL